MASSTPQPSAKPEFWRIQNIQTGERDAAIEWLQGEVQGLAISDGSGFSLAADSERTLCATLTCFERPTPANRRWHVDKNFIGFTPVCDPKDAAVDIVAVTGLGGHALGSFRSVDGTSVWLRDFAPEDVPRARFITYGYDTTVAGSNSNQGVAALAHTLLDGLAIFRRRTQTQMRPICFVCHSLGGVVLKSALVRSSDLTESRHGELRQVMLATHGLVLMGVPNLGLRHDQLQSVVQGQPNQGFVTDLLVQSDGEPSQFLDSLTREFSSLDKKRQPPFEIISYYETMMSPTLKDLGGGHFAMEGPRMTMVTKTSAERIGHLARDIDHLPSNTDHRGLVRFEHAQDHRYRSVIDKLARMVVEAAARKVCDANVLLKAPDQGQSAPQRKYLPSRNAQFVGRTTELEALERKLFVEQDCQMMAVCGLGGIGKTQVVLHFAYSVLEKHPDVSVFWVPAISAEAFEQAYVEIARLLNVHAAADRHDDVKDLVRRYLSTSTGGEWLLIVDNADDMDILNGVNGQDGLLKYLPASDTGSIVFTTRYGEVAQTLAGSDVVQVERTSLSEGLEILRQALIVKALGCDEAAAKELLIELDYLPLAITQAAAYININRTSVSEYLDLIRSTEDDMVYILSQEMQDNKRYKQSKQKHAIATTWLVSFKQMIKRDPDAADLLRYMCCIEWKAIPHSILPRVQPEARMASAIGTLCSYSFITRREDEKTYDMHRLVHLAARIWTSESGSLADTQRKAMQHLAYIFPWGDWSDREVWREYIPHAARMNQNGPKDEGANTEIRGSLCIHVGLCLRADGRIQDAVQWLEESLHCTESLAGDHPDRLASQHNLAIAYEANRQVDKAVQLLEHVVAVREVLAEDHPSRLAQHELARAYQANRQVDKAVQLLEHVVAVQEVLAEDHPDRLASQNALAIAYEANRQVDKAVQLLEHVVAVREVLAEDYPSRLASQHELARAYQANGQVDKAVQLLKHVVAIKKGVLAEDHPFRLASQHELARAYQANGQVDEAVQLLEHVVAIEEVLVEDHPSRLASQHALAVAYYTNNQVDKAVQLLTHVVAVQEVLAEDHPDRLVSQYALAIAYKANGQVDEAVQLLEHVVAIKEVLVEDHPS